MTINFRHQVTTKCRSGSQNRHKHNDRGPTFYYIHQVHPSAAPLWSSLAADQVNAYVNLPRHDCISYHIPALPLRPRTNLMVQPCQSCGKPSGRRCAGCKSLTAWYCSKECQKSYWVVHIFDCNPRRKITTADHLALAVYARCPPSDPQTAEDYGFHQIVSVEHQVELLELYIWLIEQLDVNPKKIHEWRIGGTLIEEIKAAFEAVPENLRGDKYSWFLDNQVVLDTAMEPLNDPDEIAVSYMAPAWQYCGISSSYTNAQKAKIMNTWSQDKFHCLFVCSRILSGSHPPSYDQSWMTLGFCVCRDRFEEFSLAGVYKTLLNRCTFDEFWDAFYSVSIIALFDAHGLEDERRCFPYLEDIIGPYRAPRWKSVWHLKQIVTIDVDMTPAVLVDYGFVNCSTLEEHQELKAVYKVFFVEKKGDPMRLHEAAMQGRLFRHVGETIKLSKRFKRLMKNPYPI